MAAYTATIAETSSPADTVSSVSLRLIVPAVNQPVPLSGSPPSGPPDQASKIWVRRIAEVLNASLAGKVNVVLFVTLRAGFAATTVIDARIGPYSALIPLPVTASGAATIYETPYIIPSNQKNGSVVLNHGNTAATDKIILLVILG